MTATTASGAAALDHHDDHEHPPPFHSSAKRPWGVIGIYTFIGSEIALFGSFFMMYFFIRIVGEADYTAWQQAFGNVVDHAVPLALMNSVILFSSSAWIIFAERAFARGDRNKLIFWLGMTMLFGAVFLGIQVYEYSALVLNDSIGPSSNAYSSIFFGITGLHGSHVLVGLLLLAMLMFRTVSGRYELGQHPPQGFAAAAIYWHFVDAVWVVVLALIYTPWTLL